jgi:hypothetical protein
MLLEYLEESTSNRALRSSFHSQTAPESFVATAFFEKQVRAFTAPIYAVNIERLQRLYSIPLWQQWAFEWERLVEAERTPLSTKPLWFIGREHEARLPGADFKLSELYRSAYLRALAWSVATGGVDFKLARELAAVACPVNLDLWKVQPSRRPEWWPKVESEKGPLDTVPGQVWRQMAEAWGKDRRRKRRILAASGRVNESASLAYDLEVLGIFQASTGPRAQNLEAVFEWCAGRGVDTVTAPLLFAGPILEEPIEDWTRRIGDWIVLPASGQVTYGLSSRWQYWRMWRVPRLPAPFLVNEQLTFRCTPDTLCIEDSSGIRASLLDWTDGVTDRLVANLSPRSGIVLEADTGLISAFEAATKTTFAWICKLTGCHRRQSYETFEMFDIYESFGTTRVILPA